MTSNWRMPQFVSVWNKLAGARQVTRFENRESPLNDCGERSKDCASRIRPQEEQRTGRRSEAKTKRRAKQIGTHHRSAAGAGRGDTVRTDGSYRMAGAQRARVPEREAVETTRACGWSRPGVTGSGCMRWLRQRCEQAQPE